MNHEEGTFRGVNDYNIFWQAWYPDDEPKAVLMIAHGFGEHSGRYKNVVETFVPLGYAIYALDHRGHGRSEGQRVMVENYSQYIDDLKTFFDIVRGRRPGLDIFLVGHSMGAAISTAYAARYQEELKGLVLSGGGITTDRTPMRLAGLDLADTLSRDPAVVQAYRDDPLVYHGTPPSGRDSAMAQMREVLPDLAKTIGLPILIMAGAGSPLGDGPRSQALYEAVSSADRTLKLYPELLHEIFNEPEFPQVLADMAAWLELHI
jgi:alpha-beta hydrolase superfamily lysophospholipase